MFKNRVVRGLVGGLLGGLLAFGGFSLVDQPAAIAYPEDGHWWHDGVNTRYVYVHNQLGSEYQPYIQNAINALHLEYVPVGEGSPQGAPVQLPILNNNPGATPCVTPYDGGGWGYGSITFCWIDRPQDTDLMAVTTRELTNTGHLKSVTIQVNASAFNPWNSTNSYALLWAVRHELMHGVGYDAHNNSTCNLMASSFFGSPNNRSNVADLCKYALTSADTTFYWNQYWGHRD